MTLKASNPGSSQRNDCIKFCIFYGFPLLIPKYVSNNWMNMEDG